MQPGDFVRVVEISTVGSSASHPREKRDIEIGDILCVNIVGAEYDNKAVFAYESSGNFTTIFGGNTQLLQEEDVEVLPRPKKGDIVRVVEIPGLYAPFSPHVAHPTQPRPLELGDEIEINTYRYPYIDFRLYNNILFLVIHARCVVPVATGGLAKPTCTCKSLLWGHENGCPSVA